MMEVVIKKVIDGVYGFLVDAVGSMTSEFNKRQMYQQCGFKSIPRENSRGIYIKNGNKYMCVATADKSENTPSLENEGDVTIYSSKDSYVKVLASGKIEIKGDSDIDIKSSGKINISGNGGAGSIVLGSGLLRKFVNEQLITILESVPLSVSGATAGPYPAGTFTGSTTSQVEGS